MNEFVKEYVYLREKRVSASKIDPETFMPIIRKAELVRNWLWMGQPILQFPTDMFAIQELIWGLKPDFVIETGVAHGGSSLFYATILQAMKKKSVISIDIDIRIHNYHAVLSHPAGSHIVLIEGDSVSLDTIDKVRKIVSGRPSLVVLDSNHTADHVYQELVLYEQFVQPGGYMIVMDTSVEFTKKPEDRPWGPGNSPMTAVKKFLKKHKDFKADRQIEKRILITSAPDGWLKRSSK